MHVNLTQADFDLLKSHSAACYPEEACSLLVGPSASQNVLEITQVVTAPNLATHKKRFFEVDPAVRIRLEKECRGTALRIAGVFHSHPDGLAQPSATDVAMVVERDLIWLIASVTEAGQFRLNGFMPADPEGFQPVTLLIEGEKQNDK